MSNEETNLYKAILSIKDAEECIFQVCTHEQESLESLLDILQAGQHNCDQSVEACCLLNQDGVH